MRRGSGRVCLLRLPGMILILLWMMECTVGRWKNSVRKGAAQVKKGETNPEPLDPPTAKLETRSELIASILESFLLGPGVSAREPLNGALGPFSKVWVGPGLCSDESNSGGSVWVWGNAVIDQRRRLPPIGAAGSMAPARPGYRRVQPLVDFRTFQIQNLCVLVALGDGHSPVQTRTYI